MDERNNCAKSCPELNTVITRVIVCMGGGGWYIPIQSTSVVDPGGDNLPLVHFVQELAWAWLHVPIVHWKHPVSFL